MKTQYTVVAFAVALVALVTVGVATAAPVGDALDVGSTVDPATVDQGDTLTVETTINATGFNAPLVDVEVSDRWTVTSHRDDGGTYRPGEQDWLWLSPGRYTSRLDLRVPEDVPPGTYLVLVQGAGVDPATGQRHIRNLTRRVTVEGSAPSGVNFTMTPPRAEPEATVNFEAVVPSSFDSVTGYVWRFGDGTTATGASVEHTYTRRDEYLATLELRYGTNQSTVVQRRVSVRPSDGQPSAPIGAPTARITSSTSSPRVNETVRFNGSASTDEEGSIANYQWDFDGDGSIDATGVSVEHRPRSTGPQNVTLYVTDASGAEAQTTRTVDVADPSGSDGGLPTVPIAIVAVLALAAGAVILYRQNQ